MLILLKLEHVFITADLLNHVAVQKICCKWMSFQSARVLNTIITYEIVMIKITKPKRPLSLSLKDNDSTFQRIRKSSVDMTIIRAMVSCSQETRFKLPYK